MKIKCCINGIYSTVIVPIQNKSKINTEVGLGAKKKWASSDFQAYVTHAAFVISNIIYDWIAFILCIFHSYIIEQYQKQDQPLTNKLLKQD